mgnify:FL=1
MIRLENIYKEYKLGKESIMALNNVSVEFQEGKMYAIMGRSGSGKSTLVHILGLLDSPTSGHIYIDNRDVTNLKEDKVQEIIGQNIGFVFQKFYLNNNLTALENVILPSLINKEITKDERRKKASQLLKLVGLENRLNHKPKELSGGEAQRVAVARSLVNNPKIIIADEPTGNLDKTSELTIFELLKEISKQDKIVIVVSHNELIKEYANKVYYLDDGVLK